MRLCKKIVNLFFLQIKGKNPKQTLRKSKKIPYTRDFLSRLAQYAPLNKKPLQKTSRPKHHRAQQKTVAKEIGTKRICHTPPGTHMFKHLKTKTKPGSAAYPPAGRTTTPATHFLFNFYTLYIRDVCNTVLLQPLRLKLIKKKNKCRGRHIGLPKTKYQYPTKKGRTHRFTLSVDITAI